MYCDLLTENTFHCSGYFFSLPQISVICETQSIGFDLDLPEIIQGRWLVSLPLKEGVLQRARSLL